MRASPVLLGIDLGGTKIEIIALDATGHCLYRTRTATPKHDDPEQQYRLIVHRITQMVLDCEHTIGEQNCPVGVGIPGSESLLTGLIKNANTVCLIGKHFRHDLSQQLQRPIQLENDANCFALSEAIDGSGQHDQHVFAVILGTGVGGGWVMNQQLVIGPNRISGEWGHNSLPWADTTDEPKQRCYCTKQGCIETYLSGPGMSRQAQLQHHITMDSKTIMAQRGQTPDVSDGAHKSYQQYVRRLAKSLASVINITDPDVIILGGGLSNVDSLYKDVPEIWGEYVFSDTVNTKLVKHTHGDASGVRGSAWLNKARLTI